MLHPASPDGGPSCLGHSMLTDLSDPIAIAALSLHAPIMSKPDKPKPQAFDDPKCADEDEQQTIAELRTLPPKNGIDRRSSFGDASARRLGLPFKMLRGSARSVTSPLSRWQPTDARPLPQAAGPSCAGPRLSVACMLRAAPLAAVDGFLRYYHAIGFEMVVLCFDKPSEDREAIALAQMHADEVGGVTIHECDDSWWSRERESGRSFVRARELERLSRQSDSEARRSAGDPQWKNLHWIGDATEVSLFEHTNDVQTRQSLVMSRVLADVWTAGYDWLLQLDVDELLYLPRVVEREDARSFFGSVPCDVDNVAFHNHEVMSCESTDVDDWFGECSLFKVSPHMLADYMDAPLEADQRKWEQRVAEGEGLEIKPIPHEPGKEAGHHALSHILQPMAEAREAAVRELHAMGLRLPRRDEQTRSGLEAREALLLRRIGGDDEQRNKLWSRQPGAEHVAGSELIAELESVRRQKGHLARVGERPANGDGPVDTYTAANVYFHAHAQGKQATRLRAIFHPPRGGVHAISPDGRGGLHKTLTCNGAHDPAVLHYANCGLSYWLRKYEVLGDIPSADDRKTLEGFEKHRRGGGTSEGFSIHTAARDLVVRGVGGHMHNRKALELFYRTLISGNEHGEAQHLAACGALVRVRGPSGLLRRLRALPRRVRKATGPADPPPPRLFDPALWIVPHPYRDAPARRRLRQWRVIFGSKVVARARPSVKAPVSAAFSPGELVWSGEPRADGWIPLSDPAFICYALLDATPLGLGKLFEAVEPPVLDEGACPACSAAPCYCALLEAIGY